MAISIVRTSIPNIAEALEISLTGQEDRGSFTETLHVPPESAALAITITGAGSAGHTHAPRNVSVVVTDPEDQDVTRGTARLEDGRITILREKPTPGKWKIEVTYESSVSATINASAVTFGWRDKLLKAARWFGCKSCKMAIKAFVISAIIHVGPLAAAGAAAHTVLEFLNKAQPILLQVLAQTFLFEEGGLPHLIALFLDYIDAPIDQILERLCGYVRLCPA